MKPYLVHTPVWLQSLYPKRVWRDKSHQDSIYLTFDDGPIPQVTPWVLDQLKQARALATFFVIGDNVRKHPDVFERVLKEGHKVGNHTYHHLKQPAVSAAQYLQDIDQCTAQLAQHGLETNLFRPPYGKLSSKLARSIQGQGVKVVMWDVLSADFDTTLSGKDCLNNVLDHIAPGSIVVFHDSLKAESRLKYCLPKVLEFINKKGWQCKALA